MQQNVFSFNDLDDENATEIDFSGCQITSFEGISRMKKLQKLNVQNTLIANFKGAAKLDNLIEINFSNTILSRYLYSREMCLLAFNENIKKINGIDVSEKERKLIEIENREYFAHLIRNGSLVVFNSNRIFPGKENKSFEFSTIISHYQNVQHSSNPKLSSKELIKRLNAKTAEIRELRIKTHGKQDIPILQSFSPYLENSKETLRQELNSLKSPIEYARDEIRLTEINKKEITTISTLQAQLEDITYKLKNSESYLERADQTYLKLQNELRSMYQSKNDDEVNMVNSFLDKTNQLKEIHEQLIKLTFEDKCLNSLRISSNASMDLDKISSLERLQAAKDNFDKKIDEAKLLAETEDQEILQLKQKVQLKKAQKEVLKEKLLAAKQKKKKAEMELAESLEKEKEKIVELAERFEELAQNIQHLTDEADVDTNELIKIPQV